MKEYHNYQEACNGIGLVYDESAKRYFRILEISGYTEKGICFAISSHRRKLFNYHRKFQNADIFWKALLWAVKALAWDDNDPRWNIVDNNKEKKDNLADKRQREKGKKLLVSECNGRATGYVYFLQGEASGIIKIGYSQGLAERIRNISRSESEVYNLLIYVPGNLKYESTLHQKFKRHCVKGREWFNPDNEIFDYIEHLKSLNTVLN